MAADKPTVNDFVTWLDLKTPISDEKCAQAVEAFNGALDDIESRVDPTFVCAGGYDLADDDNYPPRVRTAVLLEAGRLFKRPTSPEGNSMSVELGVMRIASRDPDIERLILRYLKLGFA